MDTMLFDMDGTLLESLEDLDASVNYALEKAGLPSVTIDQTRAFAGYGSIALMADATGHVYPTGSDEFRFVFDTFTEHYNKHHNDLTRPYEGVMELLSGLQERGVKMGIVSNKAQVDVEALRELYFAEQIPVAIGRTDAVPAKPAPDMLFEALDRLGSTVEQTWYMGDSEPDIEVARNAGVTGVACLWGFRTREVIESLHPDHIIERPGELLGLVDVARESR